MSNRKQHNVAFVWENFGPLHLDRVSAVSKRFAHSEYKFFGIELNAKSNTYEWRVDQADFLKETLPTSKFGFVGRYFLIVAALLKLSATDIFFAHYPRPEIFLAACSMRLLGRKVFVMDCSKMDDHSRNNLREAFKRLFILPYQGLLAGSPRTVEFFSFLGLRRKPAYLGYNGVDGDRIRAAAGNIVAPAGASFSTRDFVIVARLVQKKNISAALLAFQLFLPRDVHSRKLVIVGSGPLRDILEKQAKDLNISDKVVFEGNLQTEEVAVILSKSLCLILPSMEEQFGNVVQEAQAVGLPVLLTEICGASDELVRTGVNGFKFESNNPEGLAYYMEQISNDEKLWRRLCAGAQDAWPLGSAERFASAVGELIK